MAIKASKKKKPAAASKSSKKSSKKKVAVKIATKKAARKVASKVKASASKKVTKVTSRSTKSTKSTSTKAKTTKGTATRVRKAATKGTSKSKQAEVVILPTAATVPGYKERVFKVLAQRGENLESIFSQGLLRGRFSTAAFTIAPDGLPFTAFSSIRDAQRFVDRSNVNRKDDWAEWIIVEGEGVTTDNHPRRRHPQIHSFNPQTVEELEAATREITKVGALTYTKRNRYSRTRVISSNPNKRWSIGTVFVKNFKITQPSS